MKIDTRTYADRKAYMQAEKSKEYRRAWKLKSQFGLTIEDYDRMFKEQNGVCALCYEPPKKYRLNVDHCHTTGRIRGPLCSRCNVSVGWLGDDVESLAHVVEYLEGE